MKNNYPNLFSPIQIGNIILKNRIIAAPTSLMTLTPAGHLTAENIAYYELKAKGGCAVVTLGESIVHAVTGKSHDSQVLLDDPNTLSSLTNTAKAIARHGAIPNVELSHGGKYAGLVSIGGEQTSGRASYGPSAEVTENGEQILEMPREIICEIIDSYGRAAAMVKKAGFEMLMIHAAHGWLFSQFLSPAQNRRTDEFGGSLENRARFLLMSLDKVREAVGKGFPIQIRINGDDFSEGGLTLEDCIEVAKLVEDKVDLYNISCGSHDENNLFVRTHPSMFLEHGCNVYLAAAIKKAVKKPVSCVGGLNDPAQCEEIIASGKADIVEMARALLADPYLPRKAQTGKADDITPCLRCFECFGDAITRHSIMCTVNPVIGNELDEKVHAVPPAGLKRILVVGGGPGGMQAAITAAERGHDVTLCEKTGSLGGALQFAAYVPFKNDLYKFSKCLERRLFRSGAKVFLNTVVTSQYVESSNFDVLIVAAGASAIIPDIPGIDSEKVIMAADAEKDIENLGNEIVILGGGLVGCESAINLGMAGKKVTIIEMRDEVAPEANVIHKMALGIELKKYVNVVTNTTGRSITKDGIVCEGADGREIFFKADKVICSVGLRSRKDVVDSLRGFVDEFYFIGDCVKPRQVAQAVSTAYYLAKDM